MMKRNFKTVFISVAVSSILFFIWILLIQNPSINKNSTISMNIKSDWNNQNLENFTEDSLGLYVPFGITFWLSKTGYELTPSKISINASDNVFTIIKNIRRAKNQTVNLVVKSSYFVDGFSKKISDQLNLSSDSIKLYLMDSNQIDGQWITKGNWPVFVVPNTYNIKYNVSVEDFFKRMYKESNLFWNDERIQKLNNQKLSKLEAVTIASIVEKESTKTNEYQNIAGVYLNRFRKGMKLQADPTIVFVKGKAERVLQSDTKIPSPYNTYLNKGLPPGPICIPSISAIEAVLNYTQHDYLYFCAKSDFSGYHVFESNYGKHLINARHFHNALNKKAGK
jgi:UPF0755 protein